MQNPYTAHAGRVLDAQKSVAEWQLGQLDAARAHVVAGLELGAAALRSSTKLGLDAARTLVEAAAPKAD